MHGRGTMGPNTFARELESSLGQYLPAVLGAVAILIIGLLVALAVRALVRNGLTRLRVNERINSHAGGPATGKLDVVAIAASIGFWFIIIITLIGVFSVLRFDGLYAPFSALVAEVMLYLPRIVLAGILALVAWLLATVLRAGITRLMAASNWDEKLSDSARVQPISWVLGNVV